MTTPPTPPVPPGPPYSGQPMPPPVPPSNNGMISMISGIVGLLMCPLIGGIVAIIFGKKAEAEMAVPGADQSQATYAKVGIILGWISIVLTVIGVALYVVFFVVFLGAAGIAGATSP